MFRRQRNFKNLLQGADIVAQAEEKADEVVISQGEDPSLHPQTHLLSNNSPTEDNNEMLDQGYSVGGEDVPVPEHAEEDSNVHHTVENTNNTSASPSVEFSDNVVGEIFADPLSEEEIDDYEQLLSTNNLVPNQEEEGGPRLLDNTSATHASDPLSTSAGKPPTFSVADEAMFDLLRLCDEAGVRRSFYNELMTMLRRHQLNGFKLNDAVRRETFVKRLSSHISTPQPYAERVHGRSVIKFPFLPMLKDLLSSPLFDDVKNLAVNESLADRFSLFCPEKEEDMTETSAATWYKETYNEIMSKSTDPSREFLLAIILYTDKTGTDVNQRYPLEPIMFTTPTLRRSTRERFTSWRHLGFIPSSRSGEIEDNDNSAFENIKVYHDCLSVLLADIEQLQAEKPTMEINLGGEKREVRVHIEICFIMGDQLSQDLICGRKSSNAGGAGRIHRSCMCSWVNGANTTNGLCQIVNKSIVDQLVDLCNLPEDALLQELEESLPKTLLSRKWRKRDIHHEVRTATNFFQRTRRMAKIILEKTYTMHPVQNAFRNISFGSNKNGVYAATVDDHLHSFEAGLLLNVTDSIYGCFFPSEKKELEQIISNLVTHSHISGVTDYPRSRLTKGFSNITLLSHTEKVGILFYTYLSLMDDDGRLMFDEAIDRQQLKYGTFPSSTSITNSINKKQKRANKVRRGHGRKKRAKTAQHAANATMDDDNTMEDDSLPKEAFPFKKDKYFAKADLAFTRSEEDVLIVTDHLYRHGFSFLFEEKFDSLQLEYLFTQVFEIVGDLEYPDEFPSEEAIEVLSENCEEWNAILGYIHFDSPDDNSDSESDSVGSFADVITGSSLAKLAMKELRTTFGPKSVNHDAKTTSDESSQSICQPCPIPFNYTYQGIEKTIPKHRRDKTVRGKGSTTAILCDSSMLITFLEYLLCFHAWCHRSWTLPMAQQTDLSTVAKGIEMLVCYTDTLLYRGDNTTDFDTCKVHSQLHTERQLRMYGDPSQTNCNIGERGLKHWAKAVSRTARRHGVDDFTFGTARRISEQMLLQRGAQLMELSRKKNNEDQSERPKPVPSIRKEPHFTYRPGRQRRDPDLLFRCDQHGERLSPNSTSGKIDPAILEGIRQPILLSPRTEYQIWCETRLNNGEWIRCFPKYQGEKPWYDWVMVSFQQDNGEERAEYPAKVLAIVEKTADSDRPPNQENLMVLVHSVEYKSALRKESALGDTRLITHYQLEFARRKAALRVVPLADVLHLVWATERVRGHEGPLPRVLSGREVTQGALKDFTVAIVRPRSEWAAVFMETSRYMSAQFEDTTIAPEKRRRLDYQKRGFLGGRING